HLLERRTGRIDVNGGHLAVCKNHVREAWCIDWPKIHVRLPADVQELRSLVHEQVSVARRDRRENGIHGGLGIRQSESREKLPPPASPPAVQAIAGGRIRSGRDVLIEWNRVQHRS